MKKFNLFILALAVIAGFCAFSAEATSMSTVTDATPLPTQNVPVVNGFLTVATPTINCSGAAKAIGTLPAGTKAVRVFAYDGAINYGNSGITSDTRFPFIASAGYVDFNISTGKLAPAIYFCTQSGTGSIRITAW
jgi:hypothetical protein